MKEGEEQHLGSNSLTVSGSFLSENCADFLPAQCLDLPLYGWGRCGTQDDFRTQAHCVYNFLCQRQLKSFAHPWFIPSLELWSPSNWVLLYSWDAGMSWALCSVLCSSTQRHIQGCAQPVLNSFSKRQPLLSLAFSARVAQQSGNYHSEHLCSQSDRACSVSKHQFAGGDIRVAAAGAAWNSVHLGSEWTVWTLWKPWPPSCLVLCLLKGNCPKPSWPPALLFPWMFICSPWLWALTPSVLLLLMPSSFHFWKQV